MELQIDYEFQSKIPPLTEDELIRLHENIMFEGRLISPIVVWNGIIVDGHNRYKFVSQHPEIKYDIYEKDFDDRNEAIAWICRNQLGRRNLTPEQKKYLIGKQYEAEKESRGGDRKSMYQNDTQKTENTGERIARENNISRISVLRAEEYANAVDLAEEAVPGIKDEILSGSLSATNAEIIKFAKTEPEQRPAYAEKLRESKEPKPKKESVYQSKHYAKDHVLAPLKAKCTRPLVSDALYELNDATDSFMFRWERILNDCSYYLQNEEFILRAREQLLQLTEFLKAVENRLAE